MDIGHWNTNQIMQLPDHCFGERWPVMLRHWQESPGSTFLMAERPFPDPCVIWGLLIYNCSPGGTEVGVGLSLGDKVPANAAEFDKLEHLFRQWQDRDTWCNDIGVGGYAHWMYLPMKYLLQPKGRSLVVEILGHDETDTDIVVGVIVSSVPTEAPDWLVRPDIRP